MFVYNTKAETRGQFHLVQQLEMCVLGMSMNDYESASNIDSGIKNKF